MFQGLNIKASTRYGEGQLCAQEDITRSNCSLNMVCLKCENLVAAMLFRLVQELIYQGSARCNGQLFGAIASILGRWELFLSGKHVM